MLREKLRQIKFFRTLRFRLASTFLLLLTLVLAIVGVVGNITLHTILNHQSEQVLHEQLGSLRGWIHFDEQGVPYWFRDPSDPEDEAEVARLEAVFVLADDQGRVDKGSSDPTLSALFDRNTIVSELAEMEQTHEPVIKTITSTDNVPYQVISSIMIDAEHQRKWYAAEGRSLARDRLLLRRFRQISSIFLLVVLLACALVSGTRPGERSEHCSRSRRPHKILPGRIWGCRFRSAAPTMNWIG